MSLVGSRCLSQKPAEKRPNGWPIPELWDTQMAPCMATRTATFRRTSFPEALPRPVTLGQWLVLKALPWGMVFTFLYLAVAGPSGLLRRHKMVVELDRVQRGLEERQAENARLIREINQLRDDDVTVRRAITQELLLVEKGSTVYKFED